MKPWYRHRQLNENSHSPSIEWLGNCCLVRNYTSQTPLHLGGAMQLNSGQWDVGRNEVYHFLAKSTLSFLEPAGWKPILGATLEATY